MLIKTWTGAVAAADDDTAAAAAAASAVGFLKFHN